MSVYDALQYEGDLPLFQQDEARAIRMGGPRIVQRNRSAAARFVTVAVAATAEGTTFFGMIDRMTRLGAAGVVVMLATASSAAAVPRHHGRAIPATAAAPRRSGSSHYPETIEGGVSGNLPFNNQLRKLSDPLNANGGR